jgi:tyrosine decarboxylase
MAKWFERMVRADERFEVVTPRSFSLVTFRLRPQNELEGEISVDALNRKFLVAINTSGRAFMTHFVVDNKFVIRMAMGGAMTQMRHVRDAWKLVKEKAKEVGAFPREYAQVREMN